MKPKLVLASASPRRKELLTQLGYEFQIIVSDIDETYRSGESPDQFVSRLAQEKAMAVYQRLSNDFVVLGADTIVLSDEAILGKPKDKNAAKTMLLSLSGRCHKVMTAISVVSMGKIKTQVVETMVWFKTLSEKEIEEYWFTGEPKDKAGSYGIQGLGGKFVTRIEGSYHAVVGLPLFETDQLLSEFLKD